MKERVSIDVVDGVADVRMVRADKLNALDARMFDALVEAGATVGADPSLRCVVLSGEGRAFCAGIDMAELGRLSGLETAGVVRPPLAVRTHGIANTPQQAVWVWHALRIPVIAAVHGVAFGGGFQLMLGADLRYVAPDTKLSIMETKWGLIPDMAGTVLLPGLARDDVIRELTFTGRVFSGTEAQALGLATRVCDDPREAALAAAREIAARSPSAIVAAKRVLARAPRLSPAEALLQESEEQDRLVGAFNQIEAVLSQREQRAPQFRDAD